MLLRFARLNFAGCQSFGLHFQIDLSIDIRRVQRDMTQPGTNRVDVDSGAEEVCCGRVPNRVGTHALTRDGRHRGQDPLNVSFDHRMNPEPRDWIATPVEEHVIRRLAAAYHR